MAARGFPSWLDSAAVVSLDNEQQQTVILLLRRVSPACCFWLWPCTWALWEHSVNHAVLPAVCVLAWAITGWNSSPDSETTFSHFHPGKVQGGVASTDLMEVLAVLLLNSAHLVCQQHQPAFPAQRDNLSGSYFSSLPRNLHSAHADSRIKMAWSKTTDTASETAEGRWLQKKIPECWRAK